MKKQIVKILVLLLFIGCNNIEYKPKYKDFANAWERENLIGKVKNLEQYKANVIDFKTGETENPIIQFKNEYTKTGNVSYEEFFDSFGKLQQYTKNEYSKNDYRIKTISENFEMSFKSIEIPQFDSLIGKQVSTSVKYNDSIEFDAYFKYDDFGNIKEQMSIQNGDTTSCFFDYKYNNNGEILWRKQIENNEYGVTEFFNEFIYDKNGNLSEVINKSEVFGQMKSKYKYDTQNRIKMISQYEGDKVIEETQFDNHYNKTCVKYFHNGTLNREMLFDYDFDQKGNWITRKVSIKQSRDNKKYHAYTETRKIEYYE